MSMNPKGLGRGLDALFQGAPSQGDTTIPGDGSFLLLAPEALSPNPGQPRENFTEESLRELAESIREKGVLQPLLVRPSTQPGTFQIVAGERRWRAAKLAALEQIPVIVRALDDNEAMIAALIENIQRENLNPVELAKGLVALKDALGVSQEILAEKLGKQKSTISNQIRMLRLSSDAQKDLVEGKLTPSHARVLLGLPQGEVADALHARIMATSMSVRQAEEEAAFWRENERFSWQKPKVLEDGNEIEDSKPRDPGVKQLAARIGQTLNCPAKISGTTEKGRISLSYESSEQLYQLLEKLGLTLESVLE